MDIFTPIIAPVKDSVCCDDTAGIAEQPRSTSDCADGVQCGLISLPEPVLCKVLQRVGAAGQRACRSTCRAVRRVFDASDVPLLLRIPSSAAAEWHIQDLVNLCKHSAYGREITLVLDGRADAHAALAALRAVPTWLTEADIRSEAALVSWVPAVAGFTGFADAVQLLSSMPKLRRLSLAVHIPGPSLELPSMGCQLQLQLTVKVLHNRTVCMPINTGAAHVVRLAVELNGGGLHPQHFHMRLEHLRSFSLSAHCGSPCSELLLRHVLENAPHLNSLDLAFASSIGELVLQPLPRHLVRLRLRAYLDDDTLQCLAALPQLCVLHLHNTASAPVLLTVALPDSLRELQLDNMRLAPRPGLGLPLGLTALHLRQCVVPQGVVMPTGLSSFSVNKCIIDSLPQGLARSLLSETDLPSELLLAPLQLHPPPPPPCGRPRSKALSDAGDESAGVPSLRISSGSFEAAGGALLQQDGSCSEASERASAPWHTCPAPGASLSESEAAVVAPGAEAGVVTRAVLASRAASLEAFYQQNMASVSCPPSLFGAGRDAAGASAGAGASGHALDRLPALDSAWELQSQRREQDDGNLCGISSSNEGGGGGGELGARLKLDGRHASHGLYRRAADAAFLLQSPEPAAGVAASSGRRRRRSSSRSSSLRRFRCPWQPSGAAGPGLPGGSLTSAASVQHAACERAWQLEDGLVSGDVVCGSGKCCSEPEDCGAAGHSRGSWLARPLPRSKRLLCGLCLPL